MKKIMFKFKSYKNIYNLYNYIFYSCYNEVVIYDINVAVVINEC